jgi:DNA adenine methylase
MTSIPHPIPYQGSKRQLAPAVLRYFPAGVQTLFKPFAPFSFPLRSLRLCDE